MTHGDPLWVFIFTFGLNWHDPTVRASDKAENRDNLVGRLIRSTLSLINLFIGEAVKQKQFSRCFDFAEDIVKTRILLPRCRSKDVG